MYVEELMMMINKTPVNGGPSYISNPHGDQASKAFCSVIAHTLRSHSSREAIA